jgi:hypothetical protein
MKKLVVVLVSALLTGGLVTALLWQRVQDERDANAALRARVTVLEAALPAAPANSTPAPVAVAAAPAGATDAVAAPAAAFPTEQAAALNAQLRQMMASPEGREMTRASARLTMARQYPHLGAELGLTPAEVERLYDLLAKQRSDQMAETMASAGDLPADQAAAEELQRKRTEQRQANEAELATALGDKYPQWQTYQQTLPLRQQVAQLQALLGGASDALGDAQARPLVATLAAEKARIDQEQRGAPRLPPGSTREQYQAQQQQRRADSNRRLLEAAAAHLTPQQVASYRRLMEQEQEMERVLTATFESQRAAPRQGAPAATASPR